MEALEQAKLIWSEGEPIPLDLAFELMSLGYDVETLESKYLNN